MVSKTSFNSIVSSLRIKIHQLCMYMLEGEGPLLKTGFEEGQSVYMAPEWEVKGTPADIR